MFRRTTAEPTASDTTSAARTARLELHVENDVDGVYEQAENGGPRLPQGDHVRGELELGEPDQVENFH